MKQLQLQSLNPLNAFGSKCFSQTDEDGITIEILRRIDCLANGVYAEFGVGDGTENNSLILAALGWKGFWVGGGNLKINIAQSSQERFAYLKEWITLDNIVKITQKGLAQVRADALDVISLDLDGNDIYLVDALLVAGMRPKLFIVEYNAKFPPPVEFSITYDPYHHWQGDDYFGASLASYEKLFRQFGYKLVCCNAHSGANAFFVLDYYAEKFSDVPTDIRAIFIEPRYRLYGHHGSTRTVERVLADKRVTCP
jgi:hypothetical protein